MKKQWRMESTSSSMRQSLRIIVKWGFPESFFRAVCSDRPSPEKSSIVSSLLLIRGTDLRFDPV